MIAEFADSWALFHNAYVVGFVLANHWDFPPAQMTVALLCALLALSAVARRA